MPAQQPATGITRGYDGGQALLTACRLQPIRRYICVWVPNPGHSGSTVSGIPEHVRLDTDPSCVRNYSRMHHRVAHTRQSMATHGTWRRSRDGDITRVVRGPRVPPPSETSQPQPHAGLTCARSPAASDVAASRPVAPAGCAPDRTPGCCRHREHRVAKSSAGGESNKKLNATVNTAVGVRSREIQLRHVRIWALGYPVKWTGDRQAPPLRSGQAELNRQALGLSKVLHGYGRANSSGHPPRRATELVSLRQRR